MSAFISPWGKNLDDATAEEAYRMVVRWTRQAFWATSEPFIGIGSIVGVVWLLTKGAVIPHSTPIAIVLCCSGVHQFIALGSQRRRWRRLASWISYVILSTLFFAAVRAYPGVILLASLSALSMATAIHLRAPDGDQ